MNLDPAAEHFDYPVSVGKSCGTSLLSVLTFKKAIAPVWAIVLSQNLRCLPDVQLPFKMLMSNHI